MHVPYLWRAHACDKWILWPLLIALHQITPQEARVFVWWNEGWFACLEEESGLWPTKMHRKTHSIHFEAHKFHFPRHKKATILCRVKSGFSFLSYDWTWKLGCKWEAKEACLLHAEGSPVLFQESLIHQKLFVEHYNMPCTDPGASWIYSNKQNRQVFEVLELPSSRSNTC